MDLSFLPIDRLRFGLAEARHLLWRAGYGGTARQAEDLVKLGLNDAVASLVAYLPTDWSEPKLDPDVLRPPTREEADLFRTARREQDRAKLEEFQALRVAAQQKDRQMLQSLQQWWVDRMLGTTSPLEERLVTLWHNHFATNHRAVRDTWLLYQQNRMLREHATHFASLARGIVRDPAMIKFLNNDRNRRQRPNENLARELMELFTLGTGNYSEDDIKEGARALTGFNLQDNDFVFRKNQHDPGNKTILGQSGDFDGDGFVEILLRHNACPRFVALKLYDHFVADVGDDFYKLGKEHKQAVESLGKLVRKHDYQLRPVLATLFMSRHFYDPAIVGQKIKSPVQLLVGSVRCINTPVPGQRDLLLALRQMGQELFEPPSVNGWDSGRAWINTSTLFVRQNLATYLITGKHPNGRFSKDDLEYDPMPLLEGVDAGDRVAAVNHLCDTLLGSHVPAERRHPLHRFMADARRGVTRDSVLGLLCLITAMPEYQLC